jgi:EAL domain-containing protein (putative c-di-GMP-specific phosphodiesterase class I)
VSPAEFRDTDFLREVNNTLDRTRLPPRFLEIEITENVLMQDSDSSTAILNALKELGVKLAIDDFGTGYSSLNYLKRFPIDTLKIDKSFVRDITTDADDATIVSAVIGMGNNLNKRVSAEGVETQQQLTFLQIRHCAEGQGHHFSRPVVEQEYIRLLDTGIPVPA